MSNKNYFTELTRVQMPAMMHLTKLGYNYIGKINKYPKTINYDSDTNILIDIFKKSFARLNPTFDGNSDQILREIKKELDYDDLGKSFYKRLTAVSPYKLIDFDNPDNTNPNK